MVAAALPEAGGRVARAGLPARMWARGRRGRRGPRASSKGEWRRAGGGRLRAAAGRLPTGGASVRPNWAAASITNDAERATQRQKLFGAPSGPIAGPLSAGLNAAPAGRRPTSVCEYSRRMIIIVRRPSFGTVVVIVIKIMIIIVHHTTKGPHALAPTPAHDSAERLLAAKLADGRKLSLEGLFCIVEQACAVVVAVICARLIRLAN